MNFAQLFTRYISVLCVFQIKLEIYNNKDPNIITFSGWNIPQVKISPNVNIKGGIGSMVEYHWPGSDAFFPIDFNFGIGDIMDHGKSVDSISCTGMGIQIGTMTAVFPMNRNDIKLFQSTYTF